MQSIERVNNRFRKCERVSSKRAIDALFLEGRSGFVYPFKYLFIAQESAQDDKGSDLQILVSVPKRLHKRANRRNLIKRRTKEAYRLGRDELCVAVEERAVEVKVALIYIAKIEESYKKIDYAVGKIIKEIAKSV